MEAGWALLDLSPPRSAWGGHVCLHPSAKSCYFVVLFTDGPDDGYLPGLLSMANEKSFLTWPWSKVASDTLQLSYDSSQLDPRRTASQPLGVIPFRYSFVVCVEGQTPIIV
jgi:hypothetical protein